jgi:heat shock protein HslJ
MNDNAQPGSRKTRNILIAVIVILAVVLLAVFIPLTFCSRQDLGEEAPPPETSEDTVIVEQEGIVDVITEEYIELDVDGAVILIYLDGYKLPKDLAAGDSVYVEYAVDKIAEQNILVYLKVLEKEDQPDEPNIIKHVGIIDRINKDSFYLEIKAGVVLIYFDGYKIPKDLAVGDKVYVEYEADKAAEKNILKYLEVLEKAEINNPPEIEEIVITEDFYTETKYPVYVVASDPDGDELSYNWSASAGSVDESTSNPMFWTTPASAGTYEIKVVVDDGNNGVASKTKNVEVKQKETPSPPEEDIIDVIWQWEEFISNDGSKTVVNDPNLYMLLLASDGDMYLLADCNSGSGTYKMKNNSLTLKIKVVTQAICEPGSLSDQYISYLGDVASYAQRDGKLYLNLKADAGNMVFRNVEITPF